jgi:VanZ family protein
MMRVVAWSLLLAAAALTVVPPLWRPVTGFGHDMEHVAMFLLLGGAFGLAYRRHTYPIGVALVLCAGGLELMQIPIPGRHARLSDFLVDALAACIGVALGRWMAARTLVPTPTGR